MLSKHSSVSPGCKTTTSRCKHRTVCHVVRAPAVDLKRVSLGNTLQVTEVCLGTMTFGEQTDEAEAHLQLSFAADMGVNFMDTAELYPVAPRETTTGRTSTYIGRWFAKGGAKRDDWVIASKVTGRSNGLQWIPPNRSDPPTKEYKSPHLSRDSIRAAVNAELRRLQTDYIDLIQLHWPERRVPMFGRNQYTPDPKNSHQRLTGSGAPIASIQEQVEAVGDLIREGKVRCWGLSNETTYGLVTHCYTADRLGVPRPVTLQNCYSLVHRTADSELAEAMDQLGVGLLPWSALAGGSLTGKYLDTPDAPPGSRFQLFKERYSRFNTPQVQAAVRQYVQLAQECGLTPSQLALAFCRSRWFIPSTIVGARTVQQLKENIDAWRLTGPDGLSKEVLDRIEAIHTSDRNPSLMD